MHKYKDKAREILQAPDYLKEVLSSETVTNVDAIPGEVRNTQIKHFSLSMGLYFIEDIKYRYPPSAAQCYSRRASSLKVYNTDGTPWE